ncbi:MAG: hypothetical protein VB933_02615 [Pseudomonadales bacterium]
MNFKLRIGSTVSVGALDRYAIGMAYRFVGEINLGLVVLLRRRTARAEEK